MLAVATPSSIWSEGTSANNATETTIVTTMAIEVAYTCADGTSECSPRCVLQREGSVPTLLAQQGFGGEINSAKAMGPHISPLTSAARCGEGRGHILLSVFKCRGSYFDISRVDLADEVSYPPPPSSSSHPHMIYKTP